MGRVRVRNLLYLAGRVGSGQESFKSHGSGRVGSGQQFFRSRGSDRIGPIEIKNLVGWIGSGQVNIPQTFRGSGRVRGPDPTRPDPARPVRIDLTREKPC